MTHAAYIYPAIDAYEGDNRPDEKPVRRARHSDALTISLRVAGAVSLLSGAAVIFGLSHIPDIDQNSAPGQPGYVASLDAAAGAPGSQEVPANGPLLVTLTQPNYDDPSIVRAAPLPALYARAGAMPSAIPVSATASVSGDEMSRLIHGDNGSERQAQDDQALACTEPCAAQAGDDDRPQARQSARETGRDTMREQADEPVAYVDGVPAGADPEQ